MRTSSCLPADSTARVPSYTLSAITASGQNLYGLASAASFLLAAVIMLITALQFRFNKWVEYTD